MNPKQDRLKSYFETIRSGSNEVFESVAEEGPSPESLRRANVLDVTEDELVRASTAARKLARNEELTPPESDAFEAIVLPADRPVVDVVDDSFGAVEAPFAHFADAPNRARIEKTLPSIGRVEVPDHPSLPYAGTGFLVARNLLMTNRHVAEVFAQGLGRRGLRFLAGQSADVDFKQENGGARGTPFAVTRVVMIHPYWDMALLKVEGLTQRPLEFLYERPEDLVGREVAVIGYPAFDSRNDAQLQMRIFRRLFNVKRLQPGKLLARGPVRSFDNTVSALRHDSCTLGGDSGGAVVDVQSGAVVALHFGGRYLEANYAVPLFELARDRRVHAVGVPFARPAAASTPWDAKWNGIDTEESIAVRPPGGAAAQPSGSATSIAGSPDGASDGRSVTWTLPIEVTVRLGGSATAAAAGEALAADALFERMVVPFHEEGYDNREGYDDTFLGKQVRVPTPTNLSSLSKLEGGDHLIPYEHFTVALHKERRMALFTAANIDARPAMRTPDSTQSYSRDALGGLGPDDQEKWFTDPRIPALHQLPDRFFTRDRGSFDKGHLVRRDDVAWGRTYAELRRANGDTYHVTNCSPQVSGFNRSNLGGLWGELENIVLQQARSEDGRYSIFSGPLLREDDPPFSGVDDIGAVSVAIPRAYWKIVVARDGNRLASFAFLLDQDLSGVDFELALNEEWRGRMISIAELEKKIGLLQFPQELHDADQIDTALGEVVRGAAKVERFTE